MKTKLEITKQEAVNLYSEAAPALKSIFESTFGVETFKPKKITDKIKTFEDVESYLGRVVVPYANAYTAEEKCANALVKLLQVAKVLNEGWVPNWGNASEYKYYPYLYKGSGSSVSAYCRYWSTFRDCPSGLAFKTSELALHAIENFRDLYNDYLMVS